MHNKMPLLVVKLQSLPENLIDKEELQRVILRTTGVVSASALRSYLLSLIAHNVIAWDELTYKYIINKETNYSNTP
jgi:hypothetical protein